MNWSVSFLQEALSDINKLDKPTKVQVIKAINKVSTNPLPQSEGGYGKPLGNKNNNNLTGLFKIKLRKAGIRIVYKLERTSQSMTIVVVSARKDNEVYQTASNRN